MKPESGSGRGLGREREARGPARDGFGPLNRFCSSDEIINLIGSINFRSKKGKKRYQNEWK